MREQVTEAVEILFSMAVSLYVLFIVLKAAMS